VTTPEALARRAHTGLLTLSAQEVVTRQQDHPDLSNHVGVRHASALYLGALEASRQLVVAISRDSHPVLREAEISYGSVPAGVLDFRATPAGDAGAEALTVEVVATSLGRPVATLTATWAVERAKP